MIDSAKEKLETFQAIDICASFDHVPAACIVGVGYDFLFQDFINTKVGYLADFLNQTSSLQNTKKFNENTLSEKFLVQKLSQENSISYVNSLDDDKLLGLESKYLNEPLKTKITILALLLETFSLGLLMAAAMFPPLPSTISRKSLVNFQTEAAFVSDKEPNTTSLVQQRPRLISHSLSLRKKSSQDSTSGPAVALPLSRDREDNEGIERIQGKPRVVHPF